MMVPLLLLLAAGSARVDLVDDEFVIPASDWRYVEVSLKQQPVTVACDYAVQSPGGAVRAALLTQAELERRRAGQPWQATAVTQLAASGRIRYRLRHSGQYAVLIDNSGGARPLRVRLRVFLDFTPGGEPRVRYLSRQRQLAVILISFAVFFGIVTWAAGRLLRAMKRKQGTGDRGPGTGD